MFLSLYIYIYTHKGRNQIMLNKRSAPARSGTGGWEVTIWGVSTPFA